MDIGDILLAGIFFVLAIFVQVIGILLADWVNHKRELERLKIEHYNKIDYLSSETFFKKKLEYFENMTKFFEDYVQYYTQLLFLINNPQEIAELANLPKIKELGDIKLIKKKIGDILNKLREDNFINLLPKGHSLYLNSGVIPNKISPFVLTHTRVFTLTAQYIQNDLKDKNRKDEIIQLISQNISSANNLIEELKMDLLVIRKSEFQIKKEDNSINLQKFLNLPK